MKVIIAPTFMRSLERLARGTIFNKIIGFITDLWDHPTHTWCGELYSVTKYKMARAYRRILRFMEYAPIIWEDEDWDGAYTLSMLQYKIRRTRKFISKHGNAVKETRDRDVKNMHIAEEALERMLKDDYARTEWGRHRKQYPHQKLIDQPDGSAMMHEFRPGERTCVKRISNLEYKRKKADWRFLFDHLYEHLEEWWD